MVRFEFCLEDDDFDRLYAIKEAQGKGYMTGNEFARELLEGKLYSLHPAKVICYDDNGDILED